MVQCPSCLKENPPGVLFCGFCGSKMERICHSCGAANPAQFRFCGQCGTALRAEGLHQELASVQRRSEVPLSAAERRQITILFSDLVGSTQMSRVLDPEDLRELIAEYRHEVADAVIAYAGEIARYMGDGILAYFGYPAAHENDAARAIHAGLDIVRRVSGAGRDFESRYGVRPQVRVGIHTGIVVAGDLASGALFERMSVVGDTPNIAARLQELARPNSVAVGPTTARLVARHFRLRSLGLQHLKGVDEELEIFEVAETADLNARLQSIEPYGTPFQNRVQERELLWDRWRRASGEGLGQVVVIEGDAGIGKSRLARDLRDRVAATPHGWIDWTGSPFALNSAFAPISQALRREIAHASDLEAGDTRARLRRVLGDVEAVVPEVFALAAELLDVPDEDRSLVEGWSVARRRQRLMEALAQWILERARRQALVLSVEDIHWMDPSTQELVTMIVRQAPTASLLMVVTSRTGFTFDWLNSPSVTLMRLQPLAADDVDAMIHNIAISRSLPIELVRAIAQKADGVPLYVEELTRTMVERGVAAMAAELDTLPDTLRDSLMERLDRLPLGRTAVQTAAVIGRTFHFEDLRALVGADHDDLVRTLDSVVTTGILFQNGFPPEATYFFKHSLIRDAAYESLLVRNRREIHRKLAEVVAERAGWLPELVAFHFAAGGEPDKAIPLFVSAGRQAQERGALKEALAHFDAALAEIGKRQEGLDRDEKELELQIARGAVLIALKGYGAPDVRKSYERAMALADAVQRPDASFAVLWGLSSYFNVTGPADIARDIGDRTISTAAAIGDPFRRSEACRRRGLIAFVDGEFREAERYYAAAAELIAKADDPDATLFGTRPSSLLKNNAAWLAWYLGRPAEALARAQEAIDHARTLRDAYALAFALGIAATIAQHCRRPALALAFAEECVALSQEQLFSYWEAWGRIFSGWARAMSGDRDGVDAAQAGIRDYRATGSTQLELCAATLLAEALQALGRPEEARDTLNAIEGGKPGTGLYFSAEACRVSATVAFELGLERQHVLRKIDESIETARRQGSPMLELRSRAWKAAFLPEDARADLAALDDLLGKVELMPDSYESELLQRRHRPDRG